MAGLKSGLRLVPGVLLSLFLVFGTELTGAQAAPAEKSVSAADQDLQLAQRPSREDMQKRAEERFERMCEVLALDEGQKKEARKLFEEQQKEVQKIFEAAGSGGSREESREKMRKINENYLAKVEALLKGEQKAKMKEWLESQPRRGNRPGSGAA